MKRLVLLVFGLLLLVGCGVSTKTSSENKIVVGVVGEPYKYWDPVIESLAKDGIEVELKVFTGYYVPNKALNDKEIDVNAFQHYRFFEAEKEDHKYDIAVLGETILDPLGIYGSNIKDLKDVEDQGIVLIPDDASNGGRALKLLEDAGLISLDSSKGYLPTVQDILKNPKSLVIKETEASSIPSLLPDASLAIINGDLAVSYGFKPSEEALYLENFNFKDFPEQEGLKNVLVVREEDLEKEELVKLKEAFQSDAVKEVLSSYYNDAFIPAWDK